MGEQKNRPYGERNIVDRIATMRGEAFGHLKQSPRERRDALLAKHGITYSYRFVPHSESSNASADTLTLNWIVTVTNGKTAYETEFHKGIGHLRYPWNSPYAVMNSQQKTATQAALKEAAETGCAPDIRLDGRGVVVGSDLPFPNPTFDEVLWCLVQDAGARHFDNFEAWAAEQGYDSDSRKAEAVWRACMECAQALLKLVAGEAELQRLSALVDEIESDANETAAGNIRGRNLV
ncbi:hypothetical protein NDK50_35015 [Paraburkholderia bryophila]|uniref:hypothetical protein n=1 Tax=Paraburkholderia bryophila TaxID=420952 RepID=UPI0023499182|nr:hypothetical protein [Paraburkholderia bryophila]WCM23164.1 hypothetical protein NDK50_35015 [Paraburkholderia bryophila]